MSNFEGEEREFDDLDLPSEDSTPDEPADETLEFEGAGDAMDLGGDFLDADEIGPESETPADPLEPDPGMAGPADEFGSGPAGRFGGEGAGEFGGEGAGAFDAETPDESPVDAVEEEPEEEVEKPPGLFERLAQTSPYVVLLGISLMAILIGIFCWIMELNTYDFQIEPAQTSMVPAVQSAPPDVSFKV